MYRYYYQPRWQLYLRRIHESMLANKTFDNKAFEKEVFTSVELKFTKTKYSLKDKAHRKFFL